MPVLSPTNLETASYGTAGWNAIYSSNFQKLNNYLARFQDLWSGTPADWNILRYSSSSGRWIRDTIANLSTQLEAFLAKRDLSNITSLGNILNLDGHGSNLDADRLDGYHASQTPTANTVPVSDSNGRLALGWIPQGSGSGLNADQVDGYHASQNPSANTIPVSGTDGKLNVEWLPSNINADTVDNFHASQTPAPNTISVSGSDGRLALDWIPQGHSSGLNADRLDDVEESQFVRTDIARTITVQHTFNPSTAGAPFILGSNAQGRLVTGLNADQVDGFDATQNPGGNQIPVTLGDGRLVVPNGFFYALQTPTNLTATAQSGGSLSGTYYYRVLAFGYIGGNSAPSSEVSITLDGSTNGTAFLSWAPVVGAVRYRVYRGTSSGGQNQYVEVIGQTTLVDDGSLSWTAGTPPANASPMTGINFNGVRIGGNFVSGGYIAQNIWQTNTIGSQNGIGITT